MVTFFASTYFIYLSSGKIFHQSASFLHNFPHWSPVSSNHSSSAYIFPHILFNFPSFLFHSRPSIVSLSHSILSHLPAFLWLTSSIHSCTSFPFSCLPSQSSLMLIFPNYFHPSLSLTLLPPVQKHSYVLQCSSLQPHGLEAPCRELEEEQEGPRVLNSRHPGLHCPRGVHADRLWTELWLVEPRCYYVRDAHR